MSFLALFTSVIGCICHYWLLTNTRILAAVSFAYIDPVIAVVLGAVFGGETLSARVMLACGLIVCSVLCGPARPHRRESGLEQTY